MTQKQDSKENETILIFANKHSVDNIEEVKTSSKRQFTCNNNIKTCDYLARFQKCFQNRQLQNSEDSIVIVSVLDCFTHLLTNHNTNNDAEYIGDLLRSCVSKRCIRVRRNRNIFPFQTKLNYNQLFIQHKLDQIHCYFHHHLHNTNKEIVTRNNSSASNNKFTSKLDHRTYSFSFPFVYWKHCDVTKPCFNGIPYSDLYIHPHFQNLKEELKEHNVNLDYYYLTTVEYHMKTEFVRKIVATCKNYLKSIKHFCDHPSTFGYRDGSSIRVENICSILIYCGEDKFQTDFSSTYRPPDIKQQSDTDVLKEIKSRHMKFGHFAKLLKETIEIFGTQYIDGYVDRVYHGIIGQLIIPGFQCKIFGPLSTTRSMTMAQGFASGDGLVLELVPSVHLKYFNCAPISDYPWESEFLFIGGLEHFHIQMIWKIVDAQMLVEKYEFYIPALRMIDSMFNGNYFSNDAADIHKIKAKDWCEDTSELKFQDVSDTIKDLVQRYIEYRLSNKDNTQVTFVTELLNTICNEKECVQINWQSLNDNFLKEIAIDGGYIGYKFVKAQICNDTDSKHVDFYKINQLFPNMTNLSIKELENIESSFLDHILQFIQRNQNKKFTKINCIELAVLDHHEALKKIEEQFEKYSEAFKGVLKKDKKKEEIFKVDWDNIWEAYKIVINI